MTAEWKLDSLESFCALNLKCKDKKKPHKDWGLMQIQAARLEPNVTSATLSYQHNWLILNIFYWMRFWCRDFRVCCCCVLPGWWSGKLKKAAGSLKFHWRSGSFIKSERHFHFKKRTKNWTEGVSQWKRGFLFSPDWLWMCFRWFVQSYFGFYYFEWASPFQMFSMDSLLDESDSGNVPTSLSGKWAPWVKTAGRAHVKTTAQTTAQTLTSVLFPPLCSPLSSV